MNHATHAAIVTADEADDRYLRAEQAEARGDRADAQRLRIQARDGYRAAEWCHRQAAREYARMIPPDDPNHANHDRAQWHNEIADNYGWKAEAVNAEARDAGRVFG